MNDLSFILLFLSLIALIAFLIMAAIQYLKKNSSKGMKYVQFSIASLAVFIISFIIFGVTMEPTENVKEYNGEKIETSVEPKEEEKPKETEEEKAAREAKEAEEKAAAEQKAKEEAEAKAKAEEEAKAKAEEERLAKLEALKLSGSGDSVTKSFTLEDGFVIVNSTHSGGRNFVLTLYDANGNRVDMLVNTIGGYKGAQAIAIEAGEYKYEVKADGAWTVNMSQEVPSDVPPQGTAKGHGDSVVFMEIKSGSYTVQATHDGSRNFVIRANGSTLLFNEIGSYKGSKIQQVGDTAIYFFSINADGNWSFTFE
ncbi:O-antigen ligase family protein [Metasolibacillus meyeri]|uniref:O-antigen ligase family protein n=1 Tax=Metasolibacillus meyeri TaxID=1071052 RepID=UPI00187D4830|nr:O-antigen ligase family protein [Metasolibacillus meyeri]